MSAVPTTINGRTAKYMVTFCTDEGLPFLPWDRHYWYFDGPELVWPSVSGEIESPEWDGSRTLGYGAGFTGRPMTRERWSLVYGNPLTVEIDGVTYDPVYVPPERAAAHPGLPPLVAGSYPDLFETTPRGWASSHGLVGWLAYPGNAGHFALNATPTVFNYRDAAILAAVRLFAQEPPLVGYGEFVDWSGGTKRNFESGSPGQRLDSWEVLVVEADLDDGAYFHWATRGEGRSRPHASGDTRIIGPPWGALVKCASGTVVERGTAADALLYLKGL